MISNEVFLQIAVFFAVLNFILGTHLAVRGRVGRRESIESRLHAPERKVIETKEALVSIRRSRSLNAEGEYLFSFFSLNKLLLQSGARFGMHGLFALALGGGAAAFLACCIAGLDSPLALAAAVLAALFFPVFVLKSLRERRQRKFEEQLPEALDVLVRSLKAGHSLSAAVGAIGKNMPEPTSSEFSLTAAEVTYGLDLETAMANLRARVGQADLALIVLAVSVQSKTGGNLAEVLTNLSKIIRERFKLRRRASAMSAEGRFSAILLTLMPIALFGVLRLISPNYYGDIAANAYVRPILTGCIIWMLIGDFIMYRMVRIKV
jgi:tight adherence protein B